MCPLPSVEADRPKKRRRPKYRSNKRLKRPFLLPGSPVSWTGPWGVCLSAPQWPSVRLSVCLSAHLFLPFAPAWLSRLFLAAFSLGLCFPSSSWLLGRNPTDPSNGRERTRRPHLSSGNPTTESTQAPTLLRFLTVAVGTTCLVVSPDIGYSTNMSFIFLWTTSGSVGARVLLPTTRHGADTGSLLSSAPLGPISWFTLDGILSSLDTDAQLEANLGACKTQSLCASDPGALLKYSDLFPVCG